MIFVYTGKTGSGKTYRMIKDVYRHWHKGRDIYSNTKLFFHPDEACYGATIKSHPQYFTISEKLGEIIRRNWLLHARKYVLRPLCTLFKIKYRDKEYEIKRRGLINYFEDITELIEVRDGVICMDEAQTLLDSRNWENLPLEFSNKLRQHRKHSLDLYATTQNMGTMDINMRRLVQRWTHCKDLFALFWKRNPSLWTLHIAEIKDVDMLYNSVDDLQVPTLRRFPFTIHIFKRRFYDTLYDIGFNAYRIVWIQENENKKCLIIPKQMTLNNARQQLLLLKFFLNPNRSHRSNRD